MPANRCTPAESGGGGFRVEAGAQDGTVVYIPVDCFCMIWSTALLVLPRSDDDLVAVDEILSAYQVVSALLLFHQSDAGKWLITLIVFCKQRVSHSNHWKQH